MLAQYFMYQLTKISFSFLRWHTGLKRRFCMYYHHLEKILSQFSNVVFWCLYISADNITHIKFFGLKINVRYLTKIILLTKTLEKWKKNIYRLEHYQIITNLNTKFSIAYSHKHRSTRQGENTYFFYKLYEVVYKRPAQFLPV